MASELHPMRIDFIMENVKAGPEGSGLIQCVMTPDPKRYERVRIDGELHYRDRYLNVVFGPDALRSLASQAPGLPIGYKPPNIECSTSYAGERGDAVASEMETGEYVGPLIKPDQQRPLTVETEDRLISFVSIDIVGSTLLRSENADAFDRAYEIFVREIATLAGQFHASVLKLTGDGLILFLDEEGFTTQCDNTADLALSIQDLLRVGINPRLRDAGLSELPARVGADVGPAIVKTYTIRETGYSDKQVSSDALNRAVKLQEAADPGGIFIGHELYKLVHRKWLERSVEVEGLPIAGAAPYRTFELR